jgi:hypothetical protein
MGMSVMTQPLTPGSPPLFLPITPPLRHWIRILKSSQGDRVIGALVEM